MSLAALLVAAVLTPATVDVDAAKLQQLRAAQRTVDALPTRSDYDRFGRIEYWQPADATGGDCEDKALAVRAALIGAGWPAAALRLALAWDETGIYHAVLTIDATQAGRQVTLIVDSRFATVQTWTALTARGYRWSVRQAGTSGWRRIGG